MSQKRPPEFLGRRTSASDVTDTLVDKRTPRAASQSFIAEVVSVIAPLRPDLVDLLVGFERQVREESVEHFRKRTLIERQRLEDLVNRLQQLVTAQQAASQTQLEAIRQAGKTQLECLARALDQQTAATTGQLQSLQQAAKSQLDKVRAAEEKHAVTLTRHLELVRQAEERRRQGVEKHVALYGEQGEIVEQLLSEQQQANKKLEAARAALAKEHNALRGKFDEATKEHARLVAEITRSFGQQQTADAQRLAQQKKDIRALREQLARTQEDLNAALEARERLQQHVERVEEALENTLVPLRKKADAVQQRCTQLEVELADAKRALSLGVPKLPMR